MKEVVVSIGVTIALISIVMAIDHFFGKPLRRHQLEKYLRDVREGKIKPKPRVHEYKIAHDEIGISIISLGKKLAATTSIAWFDVVKVHAFKRDFFSIDCICIFLSRRDDSGLEVNEDMQGWNEFIDLLPKHLIGCQSKEQWWSKVAHPAFATNMTVIFTREQITSAHGGAAA